MPLLEDVYDWWTALPTTSVGLPSAQHIDPFSLKWALGNLLILDVLNGGQDFQYRLYGSKVSIHSGFDLTGTLVSDIAKTTPVDETTSAFFMATYRYTIDQRAPVHSRHRNTDSISVLMWNRLLLPFVDHVGAVNRMMVAIVPSRQQAATLSGRF